MSEFAARPHVVERKKPIEILRERRGGVPKKLLERHRQQAANRRGIVGALQTASKTVPEIAKETGLPPHEVFWHLMAMKKYGKLVEGQQRDDYFEYALAEASEQREAAS